MCTLARFGQFVCDGHHTMVDFERRQQLEDVCGSSRADDDRRRGNCLNP
jgi:hypothetical protein